MLGKQTIRYELKSQYVAKYLLERFGFECKIIDDKLILPDHIELKILLEDGGQATLFKNFDE